jgi:CheY-like chemotaxis protein
MQILPIATIGVSPPGLRVLVAEDSLVHQRHIEGLLSQCGCCFTIVSTGQEALGILQNYTFDVVLMDVEMPMLDGLAATRAIRVLEGNTVSRIPIIAVTARDNAGQCIQAGMDAHMFKPVTLFRLNHTLEGVLGKSLGPVKLRY